jgi:hypothetical protein
MRLTCESFLIHVGIVFELWVDRFGIEVLCLYRSVIVVEYLYIILDLFSVSSSNRFRIVFETCLNLVGIVPGSFGPRFGIGWRPFWNRFGGV